MNDPTTPRCFAHHHMTAAEYGFYDVCRSLSFQSRVLHFNGPTLAARFGSMSKNTPYDYAKSLQEKGWFVLLKDTAILRNGTRSSRQYSVLTHEEWAKEHLGQCGEHIREEGMDASEPFPNGDSPFPDSGNPFPNNGNISQKEGNNLCHLEKQPSEELPRSYLKEHPQKEGMEATGFISRFSKASRKARKQALRQGGNPEGPLGEGAPFPKNGMDVQNKLPMDLPSQALRLSTALMGTLGITDTPTRHKWKSTMEDLLVKGHSAETIRSAAETCVLQARQDMLIPDHLNSNCGAAGFGRLVESLSKNGKVAQ